ncbi:CRISPR-associated protein Cas5 [uncultured Clostridium sp.]|uniref:CRISPR-associated protein Cas5 n=1 Tax=uncultured Clostridium sp. TaxID=59620 RepID=UPI00262F39EC|nr:CRISPR-associated protein Cas5 [uncultured Clostridium sp.]
MKALRLVLTQSSANYKKEETSTNKMTYPLPPYSTVIGAIHVACGYKEYKPMDVSIQGRYESLNLEPYTDYCFLNSIQDDRGILIKFKNSKFLSTAYDKVGKALKSQGNSFRVGTTIHVYNEELLKEYRDLKDLNDKLDNYKKTSLKDELEKIKAQKKSLAADKKAFKEDKVKLQEVKDKEIEVKNLEKNIKEKFETYKKENYTEPYSKFATLTTSLKYYEMLNNIELVIHIRADEETLIDIEENIYNLKSIGRSEDFIDIKEAKIVDLASEIEEGMKSEYSAYVDMDLVKEEYIFPKLREDINYNGTKYYLNKDYKIEGSKRVFNKKKVLYISEYEVDEGTDNLLFDIEDDKKYIVNFM